MTSGDRTASIPGRERSQTTQELLRQLGQFAGQLAERMRAQQETLRHQGMNLPPETMERALAMRMTLDTLASQFSGVQIELRQLRALAETTALINSTLTVDEVLNQVMDTVVALAGAERGFIMLRDESGSLDVRIARDIDRATITSSEFSVSTTIINQVISSGEAVLTDNAGSDPRFHMQQSIMHGALRSILAVPLRVGEDLIGVVYCDNRILAGIFKEHELNLLRAFADQAAVALENARLFEAARAQLAQIAHLRDLMANVFASIVSGVVTLDTDDRITSFNAAAERITGARMEEVLGQSLWSVLPQSSETFVAHLRRVQAEQIFVQMETQIDVPALGLRDWKVSLSPLRDAQGAVQGVVLVLDDLTEVKQREASLNVVRRYVPLALADNIHAADVAGFGGQEREITLIFADVRGFTSFSERLEPEQLMAIINRYLGAASDAINRYGGLIDKYIGDAVTALFNTPFNAQEDHALRAVRAAQRISREVQKLHEQMPEIYRLQYGIGVHTGVAVLGNVGGAERREFMAIGEAVEMSKLLQENAQGGEVIMSAATYALVQDVVEAESLTPRKTDGRAGFDVIYRVLRSRRRTGQYAAVALE